MVYLYFFGNKTRPRGKEEEIKPNDPLPSVSTLLDKAKIESAQRTRSLNGEFLQKTYTPDWRVVPCALVDICLSYRIIFIYNGFFFVFQLRHVIIRLSSNDCYECCTKAIRNNNAITIIRGVHRRRLIRFRTLQHGGKSSRVKGAPSSRNYRARRSVGRSVGRGGEVARALPTVFVRSMTLIVIVVVDSHRGRCTRRGGGMCRVMVTSQGRSR